MSEQRLLVRLHFDRHGRGLFDIDDDALDGVRALQQLQRRREATLALIMALAVDVEPPLLGSQLPTADVSPLVDQLVDNLVVAPGAPSRSRVVAVAA